MLILVNRLLFNKFILNLVDFFLIISMVNIFKRKSSQNIVQMSNRKSQN